MIHAIGTSTKSCQIKQTITLKLLTLIILQMLLFSLIAILEKTWQIFNELTSRRVNNTTVKEVKLNDAVISNSSELCNAFNDHFSTVGPRLANEIPQLLTIVQVILTI